MDDDINNNCNDNYSNNNNNNNSKNSYSLMSKNIPSNPASFIHKSSFRYVRVLYFWAKEKHNTVPTKTKMITDVNSKEERNSEHVVELVDEKEGVK